MDTELKPCPFCGGAVNLEQPVSGRGWGVVCRNTINLGGTCAIEQVPSASKEAAIERWNRRAALQPAASEAAWLIEWPTEENMPARWWNPMPNMGWVIDATRAVRFARREDAEAYIHCGRHQFVAGVIATEHIFDVEIQRLDRAEGE